MFPAMYTDSFIPICTHFYCINSLKSFSWDAKVIVFCSHKIGLKVKVKLARGCNLQSDDDRTGKSDINKATLSSLT